MNIVADLYVTNDVSLALDQFGEMRCAAHSSAIYERLVDMLYDAKVTQLCNFLSFGVCVNNVDCHANLIFFS